MISKVHHIPRQSLWSINDNHQFRRPMLHFLLGRVSAFDDDGTHTSFLNYWTARRRWEGESLDWLFIPTPISSVERAAWEAAGIAFGLVEHSIKYASDAPVTPGFAFHWLALVWFAEVDILGLSAEDFGQPTVWLNYLRDNIRP